VVDEVANVTWTLLQLWSSDF